MKTVAPLNQILSAMSEGDNIYDIVDGKVFETVYDQDDTGEVRKSKRKLEDEDLQELIAEYNSRFVYEDDEQEEVLYTNFEDLINVEFNGFDELQEALSKLGAGYDTYRLFIEDDGGDAVIVTDSLSYLLFIEYGNDTLAITSITEL